MDKRTCENELFYVLSSVVQRAEHMKVVDVNTPKDAMIHLRIDWEALQASLYNRKIDGFEPAVDKMITLCASTLAIAAELQAKIKNAREKQLSAVEEDIKFEIPVVPPKKKRTRSCNKAVKS